MSATETLERRLCKCHSEPMERAGSRRRGYQEWRCSVRGAEARRRHAEANPGAQREYVRRWLEADPDRALEKSRRSREAERARDLEGYRARRRAWYHANRERVLEQKREPARREAARKRRLERNGTEAGRIANAERAARRRARIRGADVLDLDLSRDWTAILAEYGGRCVYCGAGEDLTVDHDVPLSRGGAHSRRNVVPACLPCNSSKSDSTGAEYVLRRLEAIA